MDCEYTKKVYHNSDHFDFEIAIIKHPFSFLLQYKEKHPHFILSQFQS